MQCLLALSPPASFLSAQVLVSLTRLAEWRERIAHLFELLGLLVVALPFASLAALALVPLHELQPLLSGLHHWFESLKASPHEGHLGAVAAGAVLKALRSIVKAISRLCNRDFPV